MERRNLFFDDKGETSNVRNVRVRVPMQRDRGGSTCSNDEIFVMKME